MTEMKERNAIIKSASLSNSEGFLQAMLHLDYGGSGQGFGGYVLYSPRSKDASGINAAGLFIHRCLEIADVSEWSKLAGRTIRVRSSWTNVEAIGHIVHDDWFYPKAEFDAAMQKGKP